MDPGRPGRGLVLMLVVVTVLPVVAPGPVTGDRPIADGSLLDGEQPRVAAATVARSDGAGTRGGPAGQDPALHRTISLALTPDRPGEIEVTAAFDIPDGVTSLTVWIPSNGTVTTTDGFARQNETRYEWTRTTDHPSLTFRLPANETEARRRGPPTQVRTGYSFVDVGEWALVNTPSLGIRFSGVGERPRVTREVVVDGQGVAGTAISYLGPFEEFTRTVADQRLRLVVPAAASPAAAPNRILATVAEAADRLQIGHRDATVTLYAAPSTVQWSSPGLQIGPSEFWVRDDEPIAVAGNIWTHEYVHTRQEGTTARSGRWLTEATAEYYASHLPLRRGLIPFADHRGHLSIGTRPEYAGVTLADPGTWQGTGANYWKGALVAAAIDRRIRLATDGERTLADAYGRVLGETDVTNQAFLDAVESVAGSAARADAERYSGTGAAPQLWNETEQAVAFGSAIAIRSHRTRLAVQGPYRSGPIDPGTPIIPGETLVATIAVESVDTRPGRFVLVVRRDGRAVDAVSGTLQAGATETVDVDRRFVRTGEHVLTIGDHQLTVPVREPASVTVQSLSVPERAPPGEPIPVTMEVENDADRPAVDNVTVSANGTAVGAKRVVLAPREHNRSVVSVTIADPGTYTLTAGDASARIEITTEATPPGADDGSTRATGPGPDATGSGGPGLGLGVAIAALVAVFLRAAMR